MFQVGLGLITLNLKVRLGLTFITVNDADIHSDV